MVTLYPTECICAQAQYIKTVPWVELQFIIDSAAEASTHQHWLHLEIANTKATTLSSFTITAFATKIHL